VPDGARTTGAKRRVYTAALALALPALPVVGLLQQDREELAALTYTLLTLTVGVTLLGLLTRRLSITVAERTILVVIPSVVLLRLAVALYATEIDTDNVRMLVAETVGPTLIAMLLIGFVALDTRRGLVWSLGMWGVFTGLLAPTIVTVFATEPDVAIALGRQSVTVLVMIGLASILSSLKGQLAAERARAVALHELASTDPLTGIANRRGAEEVLGASLARVARYGAELSVALLDLDRFKARNDTHGHAAGDRALREIVAVLHEDLRVTDTLGRWGGDELVVVAPETSPAELAQLAERWRQRIAELGLAAGRDAVVTTSVGVTGAIARDSLDTVLQRADRALYAAKAAGGDHVVVEPVPGRDVDRRRSDDAGPSPAVVTS
jgi:diguanylate cyclase